MYFRNINIEKIIKKLKNKLFKSIFKLIYYN